MCELAQKAHSSSTGHAFPFYTEGRDDHRHWLLIRRIPNDPTEKTYYLVFGPVGTTFEEMARAIGARWCIEEEFENAKDIGLDQYEVRSFAGWFRHVTLVLLVLALLTVICAKERFPSVASESDQASQFPIALTVPEVRRLAFPTPLSSFSQCHRCASLVVVASVSTGQSPCLPCQTSPQLQLAVHPTYS